MNDRYVFFYGSDSVFSQFYPCKFEEAGRTFTCTEQYMHFHKAVIFGDREIAEKIMATSSPREHKMLGRQVKNFRKDVWSSKSIEIVRQGNLLKFTQNKKLRDELVQTHPRELVEASPYDTIWGIGLEKHDPKIYNKQQWRGKNLLGQVLAEVRTMIN